MPLGTSNFKGSEGWRVQTRYGEGHVSAERDVLDGPPGVGTVVARSERYELGRRKDDQDVVCWKNRLRVDGG